MEWQPIETAPKDGTVILIYDYSGKVVQSVYALNSINNQYCWIHECGWYPSYKNPTHWMPLPEPPKE